MGWFQVCCCISVCLENVLDYVLYQNVCVELDRVLFFGDVYLYKEFNMPERRILVKHVYIG